MTKFNDLKSLNTDLESKNNEITDLKEKLNKTEVKLLEHKNSTYQLNLLKLTFKSFTQMFIEILDSLFSKVKTAENVSNITSLQQMVVQQLNH